MATRDEILRELKLAPEWRLRGDATAGRDGPVETASLRRRHSGASLSSRRISSRVAI